MSFLRGLGWFALLVVRGCALWVLFPSVFLAWLLVHSWAQRASLRQALSWYHAGLLLLLVNGPFRFLLVSAARPRFADIPRMAEIEPSRISLIGMDSLSLAG